MRRARRRLLLLAVAVAAAVALVLTMRPILAPEASPAGDDDVAARTGPGLAGAAPAGPGLSAAPAGERAGAGTPPPAGTPPESFGPVRTVVFVGRVVDAERRPEPDAEVRLMCDVLKAAPVRTDGRGAFRVEASGRTGGRLYGRGALHVIARGDSAAVVDANFRPLDGGEEDLGTIEVAPSQSMRVRVRLGGEPAADALVRVLSMGSGTRAVEVGGGVTGPDGEARCERVPAGRACAWVSGPRGTVGLAAVLLPLERPDLPVEVGLVPGRTMRVAVAEPRVWNATDLFAEPDVLVVGAVVRPYVVSPDRGAWWPVPASSPGAAMVLATALDGETSVVGLPDDALVDLLAEAEGHLAASQEVSASQPRAVVRLPRAPRITFLLRGPGPPEGTRLRIISYGRTLDAGPARGGVVEDGRVVVEGDDPFDWGVARAPDGTIAVLETGNAAIEGHAGEFTPARRLVVRVLQTDGVPLAGVEVRALEEDRRRSLPPARTDAAGTATFDALTPGTWRVRGFASERDAGVDLGVADLANADGTIEARFEAERTLRVHASVDGERRLPSQALVLVEPAVTTAVEEDAASASLLVRVRPRETVGPARVWLRGKDVIEGTVAFAWPAAGSTLSLDLALETACAIEVAVLAHAGRRPDAFLEREEPSGAFAEAAGDARHVHRTETLVLERLRAGRYRLRDGDSDAVTGPVEVRARTPRARLLLDLERLAEVKGRVDGPPGTDFTKARIVVAGPGIDPVPDGFSGDRVSVDGTFDVLVTPDARTTLRVWHPELAALSGAGSVVVDGRREGVLLRLGEGARLVARLKDDAGAPLPDAMLEDASVFLEPGGDSAGIVERSLVPDGSGHVSAAGFAPGTVEAWVWVFPLAPRRLPRTTLGEGVTDLGDVRLDRGCAVLMRPPRVGGRAVEGFAAEAELTGPVPFSRALTADDDGVWRAAGLCAGRWRVTCSWTTRSGAPVEERRDVEVDGRTDVTVDLAAK